MHVLDLLPRPWLPRHKGGPLAVARPVTVFWGLLGAAWLGACASNTPDATSPTPIPFENVIREAPEPAPRSSVRPTPMANGKLVSQLDIAHQPLAIDASGRYVLLAPPSGVLQASVADLESGLRIGEVQVGHQKIISAGASADEWFVLLERGQVLRAPLLGGATMALSDGGCKWHTLVVDEAGAVAGVGERCVSRFDGRVWSSWPLPLPLRDASVATSAEWTVVTGASLDGYLQAFRWHHPPAGTSPAPTEVNPGASGAPSAATASKTEPAGTGDAATAPSSSGAEVFSWEGPANAHPQSHVRLAKDGTAWIASQIHGIASLAPSPNVARPPFTPLTEPLDPVWALPERQEVLGMSPDGLLVRLNLTGLHRKERGRLVPPPQKLSLRRFVLGTGGRMLLVLAAGEPSSGDEPLLLDLDRWLLQTLPPSLPVEKPCAATFLPGGDLALVHVTSGPKHLETELLVLSPNVSAPVRRFSVSSEDPDPQNTGAECQLTRFEDPNLVAIYSGKTLKLFNIQSKERVGRASLPPLAGVGISPDAGSLYIARKDGGLARAEVPGLDEPAPLTRYESGIVAFAAVPASDLLLVATPAQAGFRVESFAAERLRVMGSVSLNTRPLSIQGAATGGRSVIVTADQRVMLWILSAEHGSFLPGLQANVAAITSSGDRLFLGRDVLAMQRLSGGKGNGPSGWELPLSSEAMAIAATPDGGCVASLNSNGKLELVEGGGKRVFSLSLLPSKGHLLLGADNTWAGTDDAVSYLGNIATSGNSVVSVALPAPSASLLTDGLRICQSQRTP